MARTRVFIVLVLALTVGGGLAYGTYNFMQRTPARAVSVATRPVVVAASDLELGAELGADDLRVVEWPAGSVPTGAFATVAEVTGRGLIMPVVQNAPILPGVLASKEAGSGLPPAIPPGLRAVSVRVNEVIGVAGYVLPGTHVDVVATLSPNDQRPEMTSKVILSNVQVLTSGTKIDRDTDKNKPVAVSVVTLLVDPDETERLTLASTEGKIQLALRNPLDSTTPTTAGIKPAALLGTAPPVRHVARLNKPGTVAPAPEPEPPSIEIIRGDKRAREVVRGQER
jgi:pilus assembly protein CpaB